MCVQSYSIINSGLISGGQNSSKRQTLFFLLVDLRDKSHKDLENIDLNVTRRAQYLHNAWKRHQDAVYWVDINLAVRKGLTFYQTRSNAIILQETLLLDWTLEKFFYEKVYMSPRPPTKDLITSRIMDKGIGFESCSTTRRRSCSTSNVFPINPTNSKSISW